MSEPVEFASIPGLVTAPKIRKGWWRRLRHMGVLALRRVMRLNDTPYRIAVGCACGIFCSTLPMFGQTFVGMAMAKLLRGSVLASIPWSWISNPATTLPIWYGGYRIGLWLMPGDRTVIGYEVMMQRLSTFDREGWQAGWSMMGTTLLDILAPLWVGTLVMGFSLAILGGLAIHAVVVAVQRRRIARQHEWQPPVAALADARASSLTSLATTLPPTGAQCRSPTVLYSPASLSGAGVSESPHHHE